MTSFNLWDQPWIPVQTLGGASTKASLSEALARAHELRGVLDPSPLVSVAMHRLLLALVYRLHPLDGFEEWRALWRAGQFDPVPAGQYGQRMAERFDLVHRERPFYQVPALPEEKDHPVADLLLEAAHGNNPTLFDHGLVEGSLDLAPDRAACYLVALQLFAIGGGVSRPFHRMDAPLTKGVVVEPTGATLFETLMLNAIPLEHWERLAPPSRADAPFWEVDAPPEPVKEGSAVRGPLHYLTWQSRRVQLLFDPGRGVVTGCRIAQRYCLPKDGHRLDPGKPYTRDDKLGWVPYRLRKDRAAWRLTHVLLQVAQDTRSRPEVVSWLAALRGHERSGEIRLPSTVGLTVSGLSTDPQLAAKIDLWRREELSLPLAILEDEDRVAAIERMMALAARIEAHLRRTAEALLWALGERQQQTAAVGYLWAGRANVPPFAALGARSLGVVLRYWAAAEAPFRAALCALAQDAPDVVWTGWVAALRENATKAVLAAVEALRAGGAAWGPLSVIEDAFARRLAWLVAHADGEGDEDGGKPDGDGPGVEN